MLRRQRHEGTLDSRAARFVLAGQFERSAQRVERFIDGKAGGVGCDLEDDAAWDLEIDRVEVVAVDHGRDGDSCGIDRFGSTLLRCKVWHTPRDVVDRARANWCVWRGILNDHEALA